MSTEKPSRPTTVARRVHEAASIDTLSERLAHRRIMLTTRDPGAFVEWVDTGKQTDDGIRIYAGVKTRLQAKTSEERARLYTALEELRAAGWKVSAPKANSDGQ